MSDFLKTNKAKTIYFTAGLVMVFAVMYVVFTGSKITAALKAPKIVFQEEKHDFGTVERGPELQYNFKFTNKGNATLKIERVQTSCGCTGATAGDQTEYNKGESGEIKVNFATQGRSGHQEKSIYVYTNDPETPQKELKISCEIVEPSGSNE